MLGFVLVCHEVLYEISVVMQLGRVVHHIFYSWCIQYYFLAYVYR